MTAGCEVDEVFPHSLTIEIPFPTRRLANAALRSLAVDEELSSLVRRDFSLISFSSESTGAMLRHLSEASLLVNVAASDSITPPPIANDTLEGVEQGSMLRVHYKATTPRMLRVAVNGFFESVGVIVQIMEELDIDVVHEKGTEDLGGVQGIEQGVAGSAVGVGG